MLALVAAAAVASLLLVGWLFSGADPGEESAPPNPSLLAHCQELRRQFRAGDTDRADRPNSEIVAEMLYVRECEPTYGPTPR